MRCLTSWILTAASLFISFSKLYWHACHPSSAKSSGAFLYSVASSPFVHLFFLSLNIVGLHDGVTGRQCFSLLLIVKGCKWVIAGIVSTSVQLIEAQT